MRKTALVIMAALLAVGQFALTFEASARPGGGRGGSGVARGGGGGGAFRGGGGGAFRGGGTVFRGGGGGFRSIAAPAFRPAFRSGGAVFRGGTAFRPAFRPGFRSAGIYRGRGYYRGRGFYRRGFYRRGFGIYIGNSCYRLRRVFTPYGYFVRRVNVCRVPFYGYRRFF